MSDTNPFEHMKNLDMKGLKGRSKETVKGIGDNASAGTWIAIVFAYLIGSASVCAITLGVRAYLIIAYGFVLAHLWSWFVVPAFGLTAISYLTAMGLSLIVNFLTMHSSAPRGDSKQGLEQWGWMIDSIFSPWVVLLMGYIIKYFM